MSYHAWFLYVGPGDQLSSRVLVKQALEQPSYLHNLHFHSFNQDFFSHFSVIVDTIWKQYERVMDLEKHWRFSAKVPFYSVCINFGNY